MRPGDIVSLVILRQTAAGAPSTSKLLADFATDCYLNGASNSPTLTLSSIGATTDAAWQAYKLNITLPGTKGQILFRNPPASGSDIVFPECWEGEIEAQDLDSVYGIGVGPVTITGATGVPLTDTPLTFDAYRYHDVSITCLDKTGAGLPLLTGYNNFRFNVWTRTHSGSIYTLTTGFTGADTGVLTFSVPENAAFFSNIDAVIAAGGDTAQLYYDCLADKASLTAKSVNIARGPLTLRRFEGPNT